MMAASQDTVASGERAARYLREKLRRTVRGVRDHALPPFEVGHEDERVRPEADKRAALTPPPGTPIRELLRRAFVQKRDRCTMRW